MTFLANQREATAPAEPKGRVPRHVAIIMDGNGRWAAERGLPRTEGHRRGMEAVRRTVDAAIDLGIETITLFSFSSENWSRPAAEVSFLFGLIRIFIRRDLADLHRNGVRITVIGERANVPADIVGLIEEAETLTAGNTRLNMVVAFNYGSRGEIVRAVRRVAEAVKRGGYLATITSAEENAFVFALIRDNPALWAHRPSGNSFGPWIGGYQPAGSSEPADGWT